MALVDVEIREAICSTFQDLADRWKTREIPVERMADGNALPILYGHRHRDEEGNPIAYVVGLFLVSDDEAASQHFLEYLKRDLEERQAQ